MRMGILSTLVNTACPTLPWTSAGPCSGRAGRSASRGRYALRAERREGCPLGGSARCRPGRPPRGGAGRSFRHRERVQVNRLLGRRSGGQTHHVAPARLCRAWSASEVRPAGPPLGTISGRWSCRMRSSATSIPSAIGPAGTGSVAGGTCQLNSTESGLQAAMQPPFSPSPISPATSSGTL